MKNNNLAARNDGYNWNNVLNNAVKRNPQLSFVASAGDQVNTNNNEVQYAAYLGADALRSLPVATTIGNHDSASAQYSMHYNNPNAFDTSGYKTKPSTQKDTRQREQIITIHMEIHYSSCWTQTITTVQHMKM